MDMRMTMGINLIEGRGRKKGKSEYRGLFKKKKEKITRVQNFKPRRAKNQIGRKIADANLNWQTQIPGWHNVT